MYCGIDLGTSSAKCAIVDAGGTLAGFAKARVGRGREAAPGDFRTDPEDWYRAAAAACSSAVAAAERAGALGGGRRVRAVAVSGNGPTVVAADRSGAPVGPAMSWLDRSAADEARRASEAAGRPVDPSFYLPKALRLVEADRAGPRAIERLFSGPEYLAFMMGAEPASYLADPYYEQYAWCLETAAKLGLEASLFPRYVPPASTMGAVNARAAADFGLLPGTPLVSAFPDFLAALLGSGTIRPGLACDRSGSSEALNLCAASPFADGSLFSLPHAVSGLWNVSGGLSTSGKALEWHARAAGYPAPESVFDDFAAAEPGAGGVLFLPYLAGERAPLWNPGLRAAFLGLSLGSVRADLARAVVESLAFGLRLVAERMRSGGLELEAVRCSGGAARNEALCALKADVLGVPVEVNAIPDCEPVGAACACAVALGDHPDLASASAAMARPAKRHEPDPARSERYGEVFLRWRRALEAISPLAPG